MTTPAQPPAPLWPTLVADGALLAVLGLLAAYAFAPGWREAVGGMLIAGISVGSAIALWAAFQRPDAAPLRETVDVMRRVMSRAPGPIKAQIVIAMPALFVAPLFFLDHPVAQVWLLAQIPNIAIALAAFALEGPTRLVSMAHLVPWPIAVVASAIAAFNTPDASSALGLWLWAATFCGVLTLLLDANEIRRWARGDRLLLPPE